MTDRKVVSSLFDKLRIMMGGEPVDRTAVRRALEQCARHGRPLSIQSARRESRGKTMAATIEQVRENDFIIDRPMIGALVRPLAINEPIRISFVSDNGHCSGLTKPLSRYRFTSGGTNSSRVLYGYSLAIPDVLEANNRRRFHRISLEHRSPLRVKLHPLDGSQPIEAVILDVSAGGMRLRLDEKVMLLDGQEMVLAAEMPEPCGTVAENVRVVRGTRCPRTGKTIVGVSFAEEMTSVARYVRQLEIQRARPAGAA